MINLLPPSYQEKLKGKQQFRLVVILGTMLLIALAALSIFLTVIQLSLATERVSQTSKLNSFEELTARKQPTLSEIANWNSKLRNIEKFKGEKRSFKEVLDNLRIALPPNLSLLSLSYTPRIETRKKGDEVVRTEATIAVTGKADTRERLLSFKETLQANPFFGEVVFPPSNWVSPSDITFSFQAKLADNP